MLLPGGILSSSKCTKMRLQLGLCPGSKWGADSAPHTPSFMAGESRRGKGRKERRERVGRKGRGAFPTSFLQFS